MIKSGAKKILAISLLFASFNLAFATNTVLVCEVVKTDITKDDEGVLHPDRKDWKITKEVDQPLGVLEYNDPLQRGKKVKVRAKVENGVVTSTSFQVKENGLAVTGKLNYAAASIYSGDDFTEGQRRMTVNVDCQVE